mmetsp:Transcript_16177/g.33228  ORF Transcript_16177/g.33228 Transcript_16177/m.33228 type:complete len:227 (-) Transcript_16177:1167-1847(-)
MRSAECANKKYDSLDSGFQYTTCPSAPFLQGMISVSTHSRTEQFLPRNTLIVFMVLVSAKQVLAWMTSPSGTDPASIVYHAPAVSGVPSQVWKTPPSVMLLMLLRVSRDLNALAATSQTALSNRSIMVGAIVGVTVGARGSRGAVGIAVGGAVGAAVGAVLSGAVSLPPSVLSGAVSLSPSALLSTGASGQLPLSKPHIWKVITSVPGLVWKFLMVIPVGAILPKA